MDYTAYRGVEGVVNIGKLFCIYLHSGLISIVTYHTFCSHPLLYNLHILLRKECFFQSSKVTSRSYLPYKTYSEPYSFVGMYVSEEYSSFLYFPPKHSENKT
jgi:hypothetical protein